MVDFGDFTGTRRSPAIGPDSQAGRILLYMQDGNHITPHEALEKFGCMRLAARILDLRDAGYKIEDRRQCAGPKSFSVYWMNQTTPPLRTATPDTGQMFN